MKLYHDDDSHGYRTIDLVKFKLNFRNDFFKFIISIELEFLCKFIIKYLFHNNLYKLKLLSLKAHFIMNCNS